MRRPPGGAPRATIATPDITVAIPSRIWVPKAAWIAIEAGARGHLADLAREDDQRRHHHPRPPAVEEVDQIGIVGQRPSRARGSSRCLQGRIWPCISGQSGATWPALRPGDPGAEHQLDEQDRERDDAPAAVKRDGPVLARRGEAPQIERDPDQRAHDGQREQQVRRQAEMADVGALRRGPTSPCTSRAAPCAPPSASRPASFQP